MGKPKAPVIGFHYVMSILFGLCRGPLNALIHIKVGEKTAWTGDVSTDAMQAIRKPNLFGGEKKEGGIQGPFRCFPGGRDQVLPGAGSINCGTGPHGGVRPLAAVKDTIPGRVSDMRGTFMVWFDGIVTSMNPYPKPWSFRVRRSTAGWHMDEPWYEKMARILMADNQIHAMNPAHIIYQCLTDPLWGRGLPADKIDENSFIYAANLLCDEGFGLCFPWQRKEEIDQFIGIVNDHIGGGVYPDPTTGKLVLKLVRADYDPETIPWFTPSSGLLDIMEDDASSGDNVYNEIVGTGKDPITNEDIVMRLPNIASRQSTGGYNTLSKQYPGIPTKSLLARKLQSELRMTASGLKRLVVKLDRRGWKLRPGMVFGITDTRRGYGSIILRVGEVADQSFREGSITVKTLQDVYGLPSTAFVTPTDPTWEPPPVDAIPATAARLMEANYRDVFLQTGPGDLATVEATDAFIGSVALSPNPFMYQYDLHSRVEGETDFIDTGGTFTGAATLVDAVGPYDTSFELTGETDFAEDLIGQVILVGDEQMGVVDYDSTTHMIEVIRGVTDTVPAAHAAATVLWTIDDDLVSDKRVYSEGETVEAYILTRTSSDVLSTFEADLLELDIIGRQGRPYPPGNVTVDGELALALPFPNIERDSPTIAWAHRDRIAQADQIIGHTEADVGPEPGTTYTVRVFAEDADLDIDPPLSEHTGIVGTSFEYDSALQSADGNPGTVWFELLSERDGLTSFQSYRFRVVVTESGWGYRWGENWGGATL